MASNTSKNDDGSMQISCKLYPPVARGWRKFANCNKLKLNQAINLALAPMCGVVEDLTKYMRGDDSSNTTEENDD